MRTAPILAEYELGTAFGHWSLRIVDITGTDHHIPALGHIMTWLIGDIDEHTHTAIGWRCREIPTREQCLAYFVPDIERQWGYIPWEATQAERDALYAAGKTGWAHGLAVGDP